MIKTKLACNTKSVKLIQAAALAILSPWRTPLIANSQAIAHMVIPKGSGKCGAQHGISTMINSDE
jgi:hypothetical protein